MTDSLTYSRDRSDGIRRLIQVEAGSNLMDTKVQLDGSGPFVIPLALDFLGLVFPLARETLEIRFAVEGGQGSSYAYTSFCL